MASKEDGTLRVNSEGALSLFLAAGDALGKRRGIGTLSKIRVNSLRSWEYSAHEDLERVAKEYGVKNTGEIPLLPAATDSASPAAARAGSLPPICEKDFERLFRSRRFPDRN